MPWVSISDMEPYGTIVDTAESVSTLAFEKVFRERIVPAGTLIMSFKLTIGRVATLGIPACHNEAIISIFPREGIDQRYLGYFLSQIDYTDHQDRQIKGNTLNKSKLEKIQVVLPPSTEQTCIADVLDKCRLGISTERAAEKAEVELKHAVMRELFTRGLRGKPQKDTEIGSVPESWSVVELGSLCLVTDQVDLTSEGDRIIHYIDVSSVSRDSLKIETTNECLLKNAPGRARKRVRSGDVIFATIRPTLLRVARIDASLDNQVCSTAFCVLRTTDSELLGKYVFYTVQRPEFLELLARIETGASYPAVTDRQVKAQPIPLPPPDEQREIVAILDAIDRKIELHRKKKQVLEELFKALLHKLMTGEIRVSDLNLSALEPRRVVPAAP